MTIKVSIYLRTIVSLSQPYTIAGVYCLNAQ